ncbi:metal-dependent hydrolase [uncultured archaeon]|nr:metal-dependent hydrolase [uncultured archaeon]HKJ96881.1 cyclase family protein [Thermoplasmataceae archaeon]
MDIKRVIDLTNEVKTFMPVWPSAPLPEIKPVGIVSRDSYNVETISALSHSGTHIDAPYHFDEKGDTVDRIDLKTLVGEGYCLIVKEDEKHEIKLSEIKDKWKSEYDGKIILLNTGWSKKRAFTKEWLYEFPGLSMEAAEFLYDHKIKLVGIDTLGMDPYVHEGFDVHHFLLKKGVVFIEDMAHLEDLEEGKKYLISALPLKLYEGSGSMARVVAIETS